MSVKKYDSTTKLLKLIAGGTLWADCPLGTINAFGGATAPEGWLLCQGQALSRTDYKDLFDVIGTNFGSGDGSTTFNLPDMRGKVGVGYNGSETEFNAVGKTGGEKTHTLQITEIPTHNHRICPNGIVNTATGSGGYGARAWISSGESYNVTTEPIGGSGAHNNLQPYETLNYIMKVKQTPLPADLKAALEAALDEKDMLVWG
jgi:microcystin-dependent protein